MAIEDNTGLFGWPYNGKEVHRQRTTSFTPLRLLFTFHYQQWISTWTAKQWKINSRRNHIAGVHQGSVLLPFVFTKYTSAFSCDTGTFSSFNHNSYNLLWKTSKMTVTLFVKTDVMINLAFILGLSVYLTATEFFMSATAEVNSLKWSSGQ